MEEYQLIYYNLKGIGEPIRLMFALANVEYKDIRIPREHDENGKLKPPELPAEWKNEVPFGKLPMLKVGDKILVSSKPICRYLASKFNLTTDDSFEDSKCDEYIDSLRDYLDFFRKVYYCQDEERKKELMQHAVNETNPRYLSQFEKIISENNGRNLVTNKLTWADIYLASCLYNFERNSDGNLLENYPCLRNLVDFVFSIPAIKHWCEIRPQTQW